jgi:hypothetical protein
MAVEGLSNRDTNKTMRQKLSSWCRWLMLCCVVLCCVVLCCVVLCCVVLCCVVLAYSIHVFSYESNQQDATIQVNLLFLVSCTCFRLFSPIIRSTLLYLQYLVVFTQVAAGWCLGWVETSFEPTQDMFRGDIFAHHQKHLIVFTVSGSIHPGCCR